MTIEDIIRMAREAGVREAVLLGGYGCMSFLSDEEIESLNRVLHFATLVAAAQREACASLCESLGGASSRWYAEAIRARGEK